MQNRHSGKYNPYLPLDTYIPDGEPKVFGDRVYLYGSKDLFGGEYCCQKYHVYSAPIDDLYTWTDHGPSLSSSDEGIGEGRMIDWSDGLLWAPDIIERNGIYYLYFCLSDGSEGVAESDVPYGPFRNARQIMMDGKPIAGIDPSVIEHEGAVYYTWGQGHCHIARLMDDMCTLDSATYNECIISHDPGCAGFHEASSLRKIGDTFVMVYASEYTDAYPHCGGAPTHLDYAVSKDIYGPYERRGVIVDNVGIDPESWNNHGSILKIKDAWYVFYHASSNCCKYTRRARVERIEVDEENAIIRQAEMTSSGFADALDPADRIRAGYAYRVSGGAYLTEKGDRHPLIHVTNGSGLSWRYVDFGEAAERCALVDAQLLAGGTVTVLINGREAGSAALADGVTRVGLGPVAGRCDVALRFGGEGDDLICELDSITFA